MSSSTDYPTWVQRWAGRIGSAGQATVEAAFMLPLFFLLLLLLCEPVILLYNRAVMEGAATEGCRLLMTRPASGEGGFGDEKVEGYVVRRLGAIPPLSSFHLHEGTCSYEVVFVGDETTDTVSVSIRNKCRLLPLLDMGARAAGFCDAEGNFEQTVSVELASRPEWVVGTPEDWREVWE